MSRQFEIHKTNSDIKTALSWRTAVIVLGVSEDCIIRCSFVTKT